jgi:hypothetical protein
MHNYTLFQSMCLARGASSYIMVYTDVPLEWAIFFTSQIYRWDAIFIYLLYQWVDNSECHYINGW